MAHTYNFEKMNKVLKEYLDKGRWYHTQGVRYMSVALAMAHDEDLEKAELAGLLHDCAKYIPDKKKIRLCEENNIPITKVERGNPFLLHSKLGAYIAREKYGIEDEEVLSAITWHTTGQPNMTKLEQIVFIADYIEPLRDKAPNLKPIREAAFKDLDECCYMILRDMLAYLRSGGGEIDEHSQAAFDYYHELHLGGNHRDPV